MHNHIIVSVNICFCFKLNLKWKGFTKYLLNIVYKYRLKKYKKEATNSIKL
jgi:hypothetical protein